ncbi:MAG: hypothetical protein E7G13_14175, partial [Enterococcus faecalis]|nr:hypothetical protein [Enterococcus faecalis]
GISENCSIIFGEFRLISEGVASVPAVYQFLSLEQKSKMIFVPGSYFHTNLRSGCHQVCQ